LYSTAYVSEANLLLLCRVRDQQEGIMQTAITFMAVIAGLVLSLTVALLAEELIFGQVMRLFFVRRTVEARAGQKR
jgi:hypothetical protein